MGYCHGQVEGKTKVGKVVSLTVGLQYVNEVFLIYQLIHPKARVFVKCKVTENANLVDDQIKKVLGIS